MESNKPLEAPPYLKGFSWLFIVYGALILASGIAVTWGSFALTSAEVGISSISAFTIGTSDIVAGALTLALGVTALVAFRKQLAATPAKTLLIADIVASALALLCCNAVADQLPTSLILNLLLAIIWAVAFHNNK